MVMTIRKIVINFLNVINPLLGAYLVYYKKVNFLGFLNSDLTKGIGQEGEIAINMAIVLVIINIFILLFKHPCKIEIDIKNSRNKELTELPIANVQKSKRIYINLKVNYLNLILKGIIRKFVKLNVKISIPSVISYTISNRGEFTNSIITETRDYFVLSMDKLITDDETKYRGNIEIVLLSDVNTPQDRQISSELYEDMNGFKKYLFYIFIFLFIDVEKNDHTVDIITEE